MDGLRLRSHSQVNPLRTRKGHSGFVKVVNYPASYFFRKPEDQEFSMVQLLQEHAGLRVQHDAWVSRLMTRRRSRGTEVKFRTLDGRSRPVLVVRQSPNTRHKRPQHTGYTPGSRRSGGCGRLALAIRDSAWVGLGAKVEQVASQAVVAG